MTAIIACFVVGILLLALEIIMPGVVVGVIGALFMTAGVIMAFTTFGNIGGAVATTVAAIALGLTVYLEFVWLPRSRLIKGLSANATNHATSQPPLAREDDVVGREAVAQTTLAPSGYVLVEGRRFEAFCQSGHAVPGAILRVVGLDNFRLIVTKP